ncbi:hypothetical protein RIF29_28816 [Crotalaria pallida]|uniref:Uncharacterized protein n=1 Tax=Crotalaria pallida TaxID=3830 RepID=A0AAN9EDC7_CROPI
MMEEHFRLSRVGNLQNVGNPLQLDCSFLAWQIPPHSSCTVHFSIKLFLPIFFTFSYSLTSCRSPNSH